MIQIRWCHDHVIRWLWDHVILGITLPAKTVFTQKQGPGPGYDHMWHAITGSLFITVNNDLALLQYNSLLNMGYTE